MGSDVSMIDLQLRRLLDIILKADLFTPYKYLEYFNQQKSVICGEHPSGSIQRIQPHWHNENLDNCVHDKKYIKYILSWTRATSRGKWLSGQAGGKASIATKSHFGRSKFLSSLRHYSAGTNPRTLHRRPLVGQRRRKRKLSTILLSHKRAIVNQSNTGTVSNVTLGKLLRDGYIISF